MGFKGAKVTSKRFIHHSRGLGTFLPKKMNGNLVHLHNHNHTPYVYSQIRQRLSSSEAVYKLCYFVAIAYYEGKSIQEGTYGHIYGVCLHNCTIKYRLFMLTSSDSNKSSDVYTQYKLYNKLDFGYYSRQHSLYQRVPL